MRITIPRSMMMVEKAAISRMLGSRLVGMRLAGDGAVLTNLGDDHGYDGCDCPCCWNLEVRFSGFRSEQAIVARFYFGCRLRDLRGSAFGMIGPLHAFYRHQG